MKVGTDLQRGKIRSEVVGGGRSDRENNVRKTRLGRTPAKPGASSIPKRIILCQFWA